MPIDIEGWIEAKDTKTSEWVGVESISPFLIFAGLESDYIFGITKVRRAESVAASRGLPEDISQEIKDNIDSWREFEKEEENFSFDELFGFSYITYEEVLKIELVSKTENNGWSKVFDVMKVMCDDGVKPENIRVVVWAIR